MRGTGINIATSINPATVGGQLPASNQPPSTLTGLDAPYGLAFDASGNLYVANYGPSSDPGTTVSVFSPGSATPTDAITGLSSPQTLAFDASGNLYVIDYVITFDTLAPQVQVFAPHATIPTYTLTELDHPTALAFDSSGNVYVADSGANTVSVFAPVRPRP